jgi:hypothetical protein
MFGVTSACTRVGFGLGGRRTRGSERSNPEGLIIVDTSCPFTSPDSIPTIVSYGDGGNWTDLEKTLDAIAKLDFDFLIGGHGPVLTKQEFLKYRDRVHNIGLRARVGSRRQEPRRDSSRAHQGIQLGKRSGGDGHSRHDG